LEQFADALEFKSELPFKVAAYRRASRVIAELQEDILEVWRQGRLQEIPGIGKALVEKLDQYLTTGRIRQFEELMTRVPKGLFDLLSIQNFGPKTAALAYKHLGVESIDDLRKVIENGSLAKLPGMGAKKVENIRRGIEFYETAQARISIGMALPLVDEIIADLEAKAGDKIVRISPAGSVRRCRETVGDIDILVETDAGKEIIEAFVNLTNVTRILGAGETKGSVIFNDRFQVDLRAVPPGSFGSALQYFTGSQAHNIRVREIAKKNGLKVSEYGIFKNDKKLGGHDEKDIYHHLRMAYIPPELREDRGEIESALTDDLPQLIEITDIRADLHIHTTSSNGHLSLEEMATCAKKMGYSHIAICDHSQAARYASGLNTDDLRRQRAEIEAVSEELKFKILAGTEVDILADGRLDFPDDALEELDFVIAAIHTGFKQQVTERMISAMQNPLVDAISHPTGRLISKREGYDIDLDRVMQAAAETGTALEINSYWDRLDLSDLNAKKAIDMGIKLTINTDAHSEEHLRMMRLGVGTARRGWVKKSDVINTMTVEELQQWRKRNRL
jgi:DNA polymerase (family 10)